VRNGAKSVKYIKNPYSFYRILIKITNMARNAKSSLPSTTSDSEKTIKDNQNGFMCFFLDLGRAFTLAYSLCYMFSPFVGLQMLSVQPTFNSVMLVGVGIGLLLCVYKRNRYLILFFAVAEAFFCVAHFLKMVPWIPTFSDTQFVAMSYLDLIQATFLLMQYQVSNR
jgi:hypothetical protein